MAVTHNASATFASASGTTGGTITIPGSVATDHDLYVLVESAGHSAVDAFATCTDNDTGGNTWTRIGSSTDRKLNLFWKKATSATASKTITVAGCINSAAGGMSAFSGAAAGDPTTDIVFELNALGNQTHAGFTPTNADSMICLCIGNADDDIADQTPTDIACTDPGSMEPELWARGSSGGGDCQLIFAATIQSGGPTATGNFTWSQVAASAGQSVSFAIKPPAGGAATVTPATVATVVALPSQTVLAGATVTPASVSLVTSNPTPAPLAGAKVIPATVLTAVLVPDPAITAASTVSPATVPLITTIPTPSPLAGAVVTPQTVDTVISVPNPTVTAEPIALPATVALISALPTPIIDVEDGSTTVAPNTIAITTAFDTPQLSAGANITPATVSLVSAIPVPGIASAVVVVPDVIATSVAFPQPAITAESLVTPDAVALVIDLPTPDLVFPFVYTDQRKQREYAAVGRSYRSGGRDYH